MTEHCVLTKLQQLFFYAECPGNQRLAKPSECCTLPSCFTRCSQTPPIFCPAVCSACCCPGEPEPYSLLADDGVTCLPPGACS